MEGFEECAGQTGFLSDFSATVPDVEFSQGAQGRKKSDEAELGTLTKFVSQ